MGKNGRFTNTDIKALKGKDTDPGQGKNTHALGGNLRTRVKDGRKTFVFIYRAKIGPRRGKKTMLTFGPIELGIEAAEQWAREQMSLIAHDKDPYEQRIAKRQANHLAALRSKTLGQLAQEYYDKRTNPEDKRPWGRHTAKGMSYVLKKLQAMDVAKLPADKLAPADFEKVINDYGQHAPVQALRFGDLMFGAMHLGRRQGCYQGDNPADPKNLDLKIKHTSERRKGWHYSELPRLWSLLCEAETDCSHDGLITTAQAARLSSRDRAAILNKIYYGLLPAKQLNCGKASMYLIDPAHMEKAGLPIVNNNAESNFNALHLAIQVLKFALLTGVRFSEANEMRWNEIDWQRKVWIVPKERTKPKRKHVVPLTGPTLALLEAMQARRNDDVPYVFAHGHALTGADYHFGKPLTNGCVRRHLKDISGDREITIASFRRGIGSWADSQFIQLTGTLQSKYDINFRRAVLGHAVSTGLDYIYGSDADFEKPCRILLNDWADHLIHGPPEPPESVEESTKSVEESTKESEKIVHISTRRIVGA
jgi:integrase